MTRSTQKISVSRLLGDRVNAASLEDYIKKEIQNLKFTNNSGMYISSSRYADHKIFKTSCVDLVIKHCVTSIGVILRVKFKGAFFS